MSHKALYREWRPSSFSEVVEQEHITKTLKRAVITGRIAHAYLFSGTRGTGKTTLAKIFARAVNCLHPNEGDPCNKCDICTKASEEVLVDIAEIDAASNNSVDNIRRICDEVNYMPALAKYKVYIIDEVHMLSTSAFNALLKTLEEPPAHVIFILCTTEPDKLPATVLSRCQRFDFHRITTKGISNRLRKIADAEKQQVTDEALDMISRISFGALRDAISLLDQCISSTDDTIDVTDVLNCAGLIDDMSNAKVVQALVDNDVTGILNSVNEVIAEGKSPAGFLSGLLGYLRNILICMNVKEPDRFIEADGNAVSEMKRLSELMEPEEVIWYIKELSENEAVLKRASRPKTYLEIMLLGLLVNNTVKVQPEVQVKDKPVRKEVQKADAVKPTVNETSKPVKTETKSNQNISWSKYIQDRFDKGSKDAFELLQSAIEISGNQAVVTVANDFLKSSLERNGVAVLEEIRGFSKDITNVRFVVAGTDKVAGSPEQQITEIGKKHNIPVEII